MIYVCLILACIGLSLWAFVSLCEWLWAPSRDKWGYDKWYLHHWPINLNITSEEVIAKPRRLKATWSMEAAQDLRAMWGDKVGGGLISHYSNEMRQVVDRAVLDSLHLPDVPVYDSLRSRSMFAAWTEHALAVIENSTRGHNSMFLRDLAEIEHQAKWRGLNASQ
jgi:hypothetical protein